MQTTTAKLYSLEYNNARTYGFSALFIAGNILLPQLCHTIHLGGPMLLPIYFFTLIGAYKYGWRVGLLMLFGMPLPEVLPAILSKSILLATTAGYAAYRFGKVSLLILTGVVLSYQVAGSLVEWAIAGNFFTAIQDFRIGIPGMLLQIFGGYIVLKLMTK